MTSSCLGCSCESPSVVPPGERLVLATQVDHTSAALRTLARRNGLVMRTLAPGLLAMDTDRPQDFVALAREALSSVEAAEVRCAVLPARDPKLIAPAQDQSSSVCACIYNSHEKKHIPPMSTPRYLCFSDQPSSCAPEDTPDPGIHNGENTSRFDPYRPENL